VEGVLVAAILDEVAGRGHAVSRGRSSAGIGLGQSGTPAPLRSNGRTGRRANPESNYRD
jgi:hypothetical protein